MNAGGLERLAVMQRSDGGFDSVVRTREGAEHADRNGFTTALVLRTLRHVPDDAGLGALRARALAFLEACASPRVAGAYAFWPERLRPAWAGTVPADVDDTAIFLGELHRHGRIDRAHALRALCHVILPRRVPPQERAREPAWIAAGSFETWIAPEPVRGVAPQVVDCCVNANVVALMARLDARHLPGYLDAIGAIAGGIEWAGEDAGRLDSLTPFYPSPHALREALCHAVECGAHELRAALDRVAVLAGPAVDDAPCCRSAYGRAVWSCPALDVARAIAAGAAA